MQESVLLDHGKSFALRQSSIPNGLDLVSSAAGSLCSVWGLSLLPSSGLPQGCVSLIYQQQTRSMLRTLSSEPTLPQQQQKKSMTGYTLVLELFEPVRDVWLCAVLLCA